MTVIQILLGECVAVAVWLLLCSFCKLNVLFVCILCQLIYVLRNLRSAPLKGLEKVWSSLVSEIKSYAVRPRSQKKVWTEFWLGPRHGCWLYYRPMCVYVNSVRDRNVDIISLQFSQLLWIGITPSNPVTMYQDSRIVKSSEGPTSYLLHLM